MTLEFTRTTHSFFTMRGERSTRLFGLEWLSNSRQKRAWSNGPNKKKGRTDQRKPGGKTRVGIWFPHKKHEVPPTHTLKEYVADTTYIYVDSVLLKIKRDSNQVQNMKQSLCQNRKHITATERHSLQMCLFVKKLFEVCRQITNHR